MRRTISNLQKVDTKIRNSEPSVTETARRNFFWSDSYLILAEENFDKIFKEIYVDEFVDMIFEDHEAMIEKEEFVHSIAGNLIE